jgi:hypothetical protein
MKKIKNFFIDIFCWFVGLFIRLFLFIVSFDLKRRKKMKELNNVYKYLSKFDNLLVNTPGNSDNHYFGDIQPIHFCSSNRMTLTIANIVKYTFRYKNKGGLEDLNKVLFYTNYEIMDNDTFIPPPRTSKRIKPEYFIEAHEKNLNKDQISIFNLVCSYNSTGNSKFLYEILKHAQNLIKNYNVE